MPTNVTPPADPTPSSENGFWKGIGREFMTQRRKGLLQQQKDMALSGRQTQFIAEAKRTLAHVRGLRVAPTRVEEFEAAVQRMSLQPADLQKKFNEHRNVQLALYAAACALFVYAFWMLLNRSALMSIGVLLASCGVAVNAYIHGFRAWQIQNRNLIRLQDAVRIPGTYLVL